MSQMTKYALGNSLKTFLLKKPLTKITIYDLTHDCGINRMTFYYHFEDIYDLVEWLCHEEVKDIIQDSHHTWSEKLLFLLYKAKENKAYIDNLYHSIGRRQIESYLSPLIQNILMEQIHQNPLSLDILDEYKTFISKFYSYCLTGLLLDWVNENMSENPEHLANKITEMMTGSIQRSLHKFRIYQN